jgi:serine palmitoyltransferase
LDCEKRICTFLGTEECILYSDGLACVSSVIPAFSKGGDLIICDEGANFHIQQGILLSRSEVRYFRHNDMGDLERVLQEVRSQNAHALSTTIPLSGLLDPSNHVCCLC